MKKPYYIIFAIVFLVGILFIADCSIIGGDAINGNLAATDSDFAEYNPDSYYVAEHGEYTEVSHTAWLISMILTISLWVTVPLAMISCAILNCYYKKKERHK